MNAHTAAAIGNVCIAAAVIFAVWYLHTAWALLGFIFLFSSQTDTDKNTPGEG